MNFSTEISSGDQSTITSLSQLCEANDFDIRQTNEYEQIINGKQGFILWGIVFPLITVLGSIGNLITILVLRRDPLMSTLTILLIALAISDILAPQANALVGFSHYHLSYKYSNSVEFLKFYDILRYIIHPLSTLFTMSSSWIVTIATLFRLIAVMWPFKARTLIDRKIATISLLVIFGFSLASIIPIYSSLVTVKKCTSDNKIQYAGLSIKISNVFLHKAYIPYIHIMSFYLPWLISLVLWLFLLRSLRQSERNFNFNFTFSSKDSKNMPQSMNNSIYNTVETQFKNRESFGNHHSNEACCHAKLLSNQNSKKNVASEILLRNGDSRVNNAQIRMRTNRFNKITLMVVVLCFTNLICRVFTFVFIFEAIFNQFILKDSINIQENISETVSTYESSNLNSSTYDLSKSNLDSDAYIHESAKTIFPKFMSYSLLLNNIFLCINHSCNILIYTFTNPRFKRNLISLFKHNLFCRKCFAKNKNIINNTNNNNNNNNNQNDLGNINQNEINFNENIKKTNHKSFHKQNSEINSSIHFQHGCQNSSSNEIKRLQTKTKKLTEEKKIYLFICPIKRFNTTKKTSGQPSKC